MLTRLLILYRRLRRRRDLSFGVVLVSVVVAVFGNALTYWYFDGRLNPEIGFDDAVWYSLVSITTIGYGDYYAQSVGSRIGLIVFIMLLGLSAFTVLLGLIIDNVTEFVRRGERGMETVISRDHVLLVNFPGEARVRQLIAELESDPDTGDRDIVVVTDQIQELPFASKHVAFVHGSPLLLETLERARVRDARMALVLSPAYSDPNSDALVASICTIIDRIRPEIHIVAECLHEEHRTLFESANCDAVVPVLQIGGNLLVQEVADPGVTQLISTMTTNRHGQTLFSTTITDPATGEATYKELASRLLAHDVNLIGINRGPESLTSLGSLRPRAEDVLVYLADRRWSWPAIRDV